MNGTRGRKRETVIVTVRGQLLDKRSFTSKLDADTYKRASRAWAMRNGIVVEVWSDRVHAGVSSPASPTLIAQAG